MQQVQTENTAGAFTLEPPAPVALPSLEQAQHPIVPMAPAEKSSLDVKIAAKVDDFVARISAAELQSDAFRDMLDRADAAGRKEVVDVTTFINNNPLLRQTTFQEYGNTAGAKAVQEMSAILAKANPKGRDLLGPVKVLGIPVPFGNKLRDYFDEFKSQGERLTELATVLEAEEDAQRREILSYDVVERQLFELVQRLDQATSYLSALDSRLEQQAGIESNPEKAKALREEVLFYVRGNLNDVVQVKLLAVVGIGQIRQLRHTGRMTMRGTNRVKTLGMTALAIAQTMAVATYNQKKRAELNQAAQAAVNAVVAGVGDAILDHTKMVTEFESNPVFGIQALESGIEKTLEAINLLNNFRSAAVDTMKTDNDKLSALYSKAKTSMRIEDGTAVEAKGQYGDVLSL